MRAREKKPVGPGDEVRVQGRTCHGFVVAVGKESPASAVQRVLLWFPNDACYHSPQIVEVSEYEVEKV